MSSLLPREVQAADRYILSNEMNQAQAKEKRAVGQTALRQVGVLVCMSPVLQDDKDVVINDW